MSLQINGSNSLEQLAVQLSKELHRQQNHVFQPQYIVTQTQGMNNWLKIKNKLTNAALVSFRKKESENSNGDDKQDRAKKRSFKTEGSTGPHVGTSNCLLHYACQLQTANVEAQHRALKVIPGKMKADAKPEIFGKDVIKAK